MSHELYNNIINTVPDAPPEVGIIFGRKSNQIDHYYMDNGLDCILGCYTPDIARINNVISDWAMKGIRFVGFAHTHHSVATLSSSDNEYIFEILKAIQSYTSTLYFPVIIPKKVMVCYCAKVHEGKVIITEETIELL